MSEAPGLTAICTEVPIGDLEAIGAALMQAGILTAAFDPPREGLLAVGPMLHAHVIQQQTTVVLPDRNLVSEIARIAREGGIDRAKSAHVTAAQLMAYCQALNIHIEPSISYHELAHRVGNDAAHEELGWFRSSDHGQAQAWIDLALGRTDRLTSIPPPSEPSRDLQRPLRRWRRNYAVALQIAQLALTPAPPLERFERLLAWMIDDFFFAGPAATFALMFFSARAPKGGMFKKLESANRELAIAGVRNAAWDITSLSDFIRRVSQPETSSDRCMFATSDKALGAVAPLVLLDPVDPLRRKEYLAALSAWWTRREAVKITDLLRAGLLQAQARGPVDRDLAVVDDWIVEGEAWLRRWRAER